MPCTPSIKLPSPGTAAARALTEALEQYVQNQEEFVLTYETTVGDKENLRQAQMMLEQLTAEMIKAAGA